MASWIQNRSIEFFRTLSIQVTFIYWLDLMFADKAEDWLETDPQAVRIMSLYPSNATVAQIKALCPERFPPFEENPVPEISVQPVEESVLPVPSKHIIAEQPAIASATITIADLRSFLRASS